MAEPTAKSIPAATARRTLFKGLFAGIAIGVFWRGNRAAAAPSVIVQPDNPTHEAFMRRAFEMRTRAQNEGDQPYGAVVVKDGRIVGEAPSRVISGRDPTAHAEVEAIRDAARRLGTRDLRGSIVYASFRPCPMCESASYWAGIQRFYHGSDLVDGGPPRYLSC